MFVKKKCGYLEKRNVFVRREIVLKKCGDADIFI